MKRLIALLITLVLLALILLSVDRQRLWETLRQTRPDYFAAAMVLFIPQIWVISHRWRRMIGALAPIGFGESVRLVLASQSMNLVLPSKMGDLTKAWFLKRSGALDLARATQVVVLEKMLDVAALCVWMLIGLGIALVEAAWKPGSLKFGGSFWPLAAAAGGIGVTVVGTVAAIYFVPTQRLPLYGRWVAFLAARPKLAKIHRLFASGHEVMALLQRSEARRAGIVALSLAIWLLHLVQINFFFHSLGAAVPLSAFVAFLPLALFVGLLPFSIAGIGTRDAAVILLFSPYHPAAVLAGVGFYLSLRYVIPAACGLPFLNRYLALTAGESGEEKSKKAGAR